MTEKIILTSVALLMLVSTLKKRENQLSILTAGLTLGILITWSGISSMITIGMIIYILFALLIAITNFKDKECSKFNQVSIVLTAIFAFGTNLSSLMNWPYANEIRWLSTLPFFFI